MTRKEAEENRSNLSGTDLSGTDLSGTDLRRADLSGADLRRTDLRGTKNIPPLAAAQTLIVTPGCELIAYKSVVEGVVTLRVPADALRSNATGRKCRASKVIVINTPNHIVARSKYDATFTYVEGEVLEVKDFDTDRWNECSTGIHFFLTKEEAENYV